MLARCAWLLPVGLSLWCVICANKSYRYPWSLLFSVFGFVTVCQLRCAYRSLGADTTGTTVVVYGYNLHINLPVAK